MFYRKLHIGLWALVVLGGLTQNAYANSDLNELQRLVDRLQNNATLTLTRNYSIDGTVNIKSKRNITLNGGGYRIRQLSPYKVTLRMDKCENVTVTLLELVGHPGSYNGVRNNAKGIFLLGCTGSHRINQVTFRDHGFTGLEGFNTGYVTIENCSFSADNVVIRKGDNFNFGIYGYMNCNYWEVKNCTFKNLCTGICVGSNSDYLKFHNNEFKEMRGQHGIYLAGSSFVDIYSNTFANIAHIAIKLQMGENHRTDESNIDIYENNCTNKADYGSGVAGVVVAKLPGNQHDVWWRNVFISNNTIDGFGYGINVGYTEISHIMSNTISNTKYGIFVHRYAGSLLSNLIDHAVWSGIYCSVKGNSSVDMDGNEIRDAVHITKGMTYRRCCIFITGRGFVSLRNNRMYKEDGQPLYGLFQNSGISASKYYNRLLKPVRVDGQAEQQYEYGNDYHDE